MALWPFSKKKDKDKTVVEKEEVTTQPQTDDAVESISDSGTGADLITDDSASLEPEIDVATEQSESDEFSDSEPDPIHDAIGGDRGPFDGDTVSIEDFDFSDFSNGVLNLGSMLIPLPHGSEVQVEMGPEGPTMLHVLTEYGRCTPVAFAAPRTAGQWRETVKELTEGMRNDGLEVRIEYGPWGREIVGSAPGAGGVVRIIGVDGPRWMLRMTLAAPVEHADQMAELGREITARTFVLRGQEPILAGSSLPVALPGPLAEQVQKEMIRRQQEANTQSES
ncbi:putative DUF3710 family protein [Corynebacterium mustelae]|uniref:Putative DUF3710 family protein n=1 Tax=Corynebacterium mustelae TaxID=571915 RepID=A0A0G3GY63_9CORY|nr:DUF3710 domain-containing protein [Corynebacterium mustelae]AKK06099.1 putative DUF3710 family protein [Corynebacterium mustelae]